MAEEDEALAQADLILQQRREKAAAKRPQGAPLLHAASFSNSVGELPFFDAGVIPTAPPKPGVYSRRAMLEEALKARARTRITPCMRSNSVIRACCPPVSPRYLACAGGAGARDGRGHSVARSPAAGALPASFF